MMIVTLSRWACRLNGFVGEFPFCSAASVQKHWAALVTRVATVGVILAAVYLLVMYEKSSWGGESGSQPGLKDITLREVLVLLPLLIMIFWIACTAALL